MRKVTVCLLALLLGRGALAAISVPSAPMNWTNRHEEGWFWYQDPDVTAPAKKPKELEQRPQIPLDPLNQLKQIQEELNRAQARAVLHPSPENVYEYLRLNQWRLNQASKFSDVWRRVVWQNPNLDYSLRRPVMNLAVHTYQDQRKQKEAQAVAAVAQTHGLFFFFKGSCPYCHAFGPILRRFSEMYGIDVLAVSLDGGGLPDYPNPRVDTQVANQLGVSAVPSLFLVDPKRRDVLAVGAGVMSLDELADRIYVLTQTRAGQDY